MRYLPIAGVWLLLGSGLSGCAGCSEHGADAVRTVVTQAESLLEEGDLLFRRGRGMASRAVLMHDPAGVYSHVGMAVQEEGAWFVVHAVPGEPDYTGDPDRVKRDSLHVFFSAERAIRGEVMRVSDAGMATQAARWAKEIARRRVLFDHDYDLGDTTRMYCTELVQHLFRHGGLDLSVGRRSHIALPGFGGEYILPGDLLQSPHLRSIYTF